MQKVLNQSIGSEIKKQSLWMALKVSAIVLIVSVVSLFSFQIRQQHYAITKKLEVDKGFIAKSLEIGDLFFITQYVDAFVKSGVVEFAGVRKRGADDWVAQVPRLESVDTSPRLGFSMGPLSIQVNESWFLPVKNSAEWEVSYSYRISYVLFFWALVFSAGISFFIFYMSRSLLQRAAHHISKPVEALSKDLEQQKQKGLSHLELKEYEKAVHFVETDAFVETLRGLLAEISEQQEHLKDIEVLKALNRVSRQVNHDIQSPVGALKVAVENLSADQSQQKSLIKKAVSRIEAIAADLRKTGVEKRGESNHYPEQVDLKPLLDDLVKEKITEYKNKNVSIRTHFEAEKLIWTMNSSEFLRAVSNIINNGIEAVENKNAEIDIFLGREGSSHYIEIRDNGQGVPEEIEKHIFNYGFTAGKKGGAGTGLPYASMVFEKNGARLSYVKLSSGAGFRISFPSVDK